MYYGLKQGQITSNVENKYVLKLTHLVVHRSKITLYNVISKMYITSFFRILTLSSNNVRMSEGIFCRVEVHICTNGTCNTI